MKRVLVFNNHSVGGSYSKLQITGTGAERATICGGQVITGWTLWKNGVFRAPLPPGFLTRQLYLNGRPAIRARYPNRTNDRDFGPYLRVKRFDRGDKTIIINANDAPNYTAWNNLRDIELVINQHHYQNRVRIEAIQRVGTELVITPREPERDQLFQRDQHSMLDDGKTFYFENAPEFVDQNNEFYDDAVNNFIYYRPASGTVGPGDTLIAPVLENIVRIAGSVQNPLANITIQNLNLGYTTWLMPSKQGNIATQAAIMEFVNRRYHIPAIVDVKYAEHIRIKDCDLFDGGGNGVVLEKAVKHSAVLNNHIFYIGANGVYIETFTFTHFDNPMPDSILCKSDSIVNNLCENEGYYITNGEAFMVGAASNTLIEHNEVCYLRYSGFQVGNLFGDHAVGAGSNIIRYNNVHDVLLLHDDGGAIYTAGNQPGTEIYGNWIHDIHKSNWADRFPLNAIYLDAWSAYMKVHDNKFSNLVNVNLVWQQDSFGAQAHNNDVNNNTTTNPNAQPPNTGLMRK